MNTDLSASAKGATYLILIQVISRASTFVCNQFVLRFLSPELLGAATQLELYSISVLYFAREALRVALQRRTDNPQSAINTSYISLLLGLPLAYIFAVLFVENGLPEVPFIYEALKLYAAATIIELASEPCFVLVQHKLAYGVRARAETFATIGRSLVNLGVVFWAARNGVELGVLPFAFSQLAYACLLALVYLVNTTTLASSEKLSLLPERLSSADTILYFFSRTLCGLALTLYVQSGIKYVLTQGDGLLIARMSTLGEQGAYALASNYGGLIARMLFQPIEESSRNLFAKLCSSSPEPKNDAHKDNISRAKSIVEDILRFYSILAAVAWVVGPTLAPLLLELLVGSKWSDTGAGEVLATYCYYIPLLAVNGVTEAFVAAVATSAELQRQSLYMGAYFVGFASAAYLFLGVLKAGAQGLVYANCVNMILRIIFNWHFIKTFFKKHGQHFDLKGTLPTGFTFFAGSVVQPMLRRGWFVADQTPFVRLLGQGAIVGMFGLVLIFSERKFLLHCYELLASRGASIKTTK